MNVDSPTLASYPEDPHAEARARAQLRRLNTIAEQHRRLTPACRRALKKVDRVLGRANPMPGSGKTGRHVPPRFLVDWKD